MGTVAGLFSQLFFLVFALAVFLTQGALALPSGTKAPEWTIAEWINSEEPLSVEKLRGKVIVIDFFQLWCPGCKSFSIPLMNHWEKVFEKEAADGQIAFISIHTVFEGHGYQSPKRLRRFLKEKQIKHPVGIDRHVEGRRTPETMRAYDTGGTPEMVIIDKRGFIRFQKFGYFEPESGERLIRHLLNEAPPPVRASLSPSRRY